MWGSWWRIKYGNGELRVMRAWWQDVLINTGGAALGAIIAAGVITVAGKVAGLFDAEVDFKPVEFLQIIAGLVGAVAGIVAIFTASLTVFR